MPLDDFRVLHLNFHTQQRARDIARCVPKRSGAWYLSSQGKRGMPNPSASMESPDIERHLPSCPLPESNRPKCTLTTTGGTGAPLAPSPGQFLPSSPHHRWLSHQLPQFLVQQTACLPECTVQHWGKGPHQPEDHVALQEVTVEEKETHTCTPALWGSLEQSLPLPKPPGLWGEAPAPLYLTTV